MPFPLWAAMALAGAAKAELVDRPKEKRQRDLAVATTKYSPWTGLKAGPIQEADPFGSALNWGTTGAIMKNNMDMNDAYTNRLNSGGSIIGYGKEIPQAGSANFPQLQPPKMLKPQASGWSWEGGADLRDQTPWTLSKDMYLGG
jgi:hypothetical protein